MTAVTDPSRAAPGAGDVAALDELVVECRACPRLVAWREEVAGAPRASFAGQTYWARPLPGFGPADARLLLVGLAPAAHGGNRTGRMFTGDRSGDFLYAALHRCGLANQPTATSRDDGLVLRDTRVTAAVRCAPPANRPTPQERDTCRSWLVRELELLAPTVRVVVALGGFAWQALWPAWAAAGLPGPRQRTPFGHGVVVAMPAGRHVLGCYHPSQQNTFTGRLTPSMMDDVLRRARELAG